MCENIFKMHALFYFELNIATKFEAVYGLKYCFILF